MRYLVRLYGANSAKLVRNFQQHQQWFESDVNKTAVTYNEGSFIIRPNYDEYSDKLFFKIKKVLDSKNVRYEVWSITDCDKRIVYANKL